MVLEDQHRDGWPDPQAIATRREFADALTQVRVEAGLSIRDVAKETHVPVATLGGYYRGRYLPQLSQQDVLRRILLACGVTDPIVLQSWQRTLLRLRSSPGMRTAGAPEPYRGLQTFQLGDADWFFGRKRLTDQLLARLADHYRNGGILPVIGVSGSGKSSLLRAGLLAALSRGELEVPASADWPWLLFTPGEHPLSVLADRLAAESGSIPVEVAQALRSDPATAADLSRMCCMMRVADNAEPESGALKADPRLVLIVDQFEEIFSACTDEQERAAFIAALSAAADQGSSGSPNDDGIRGPGDAHPAALVVVSLRADFYSNALSRPDLEPMLRRGHIVVGPMTEEELRDVIVEPARMAGVGLEAGLVELLLRDLRPSVRAERSDGAHEAGALPLLSHALGVTWEGRRQREGMTVAEYEASGGISGAVTKSAESAFEELTDAHQELARQLFLRLVHISDDGTVTRRRVNRTELLQSYDESMAEELIGVLDSFAARRLITLDSDRVEITHESLLWTWHRLHDWIDADRSGLPTHRQLTAAAQAWRDCDRDPGALYRGGRLVQAEEWASAVDHASILNQLERDFLAASTAQRDAERQADRRRTLRLVQLLAATCVLAVLATSVAAYAVIQRRAAVTQRDVAVSRQVASDADRLRDSDPALAAQLSLVAYRTAPTLEARSSLLDSLAGPVPTRVAGAAVPVTTAFSSDGETMAVGGADPGDTTLRLWSLADTRHPTALSLPQPGHNGPIYALAFSPNGHLLASSGTDQTVRIWDVRQPEKPLAVHSGLGGPGGTVFSSAFSGDGQLLAAGGADRTVRVWNVTNPRQPIPVAVLTGATGDVQSVAFRPGSRVLAAGSRDHSVRLWDLADPTRPRALGTPLAGPRSVLFVAFSPDGLTLAASGADKTVRLWDVSDPATPIPRGDPLAGPAGLVNAVALSSTGSRVGAASSDNRVWIWDLPSRRVIETLPHPAPVTMVRFVKGDQTLVTSSADGTIRLWDLPGPVIADPTDTIFTASIGSDGRTLLVGADGSDRRVRLWNVTDPRRPVPLGPAMTAPPNLGLSGAAALSPDRRTVAAGTLTGPVVRWNVTDPLHPTLVEPILTGSGQNIESTTFSPDGRSLAVASDDGTVRLWDLSDPHAPTSVTLDEPEQPVYATAFSADGRLLAAASGDKKVWLWDLQLDRSRPRLAASLPGATKEVYSVAISPNNRILGAGSADKTIRLWDISDPYRPAPLGDPVTGPNNTVYWLTFSPDGHSLSAGAGDGTIWLWDVTDPWQTRATASLTTLANAVWMVSFSPDGHTLAAGGADRTVRLWETDPGVAASLVCALTGDSITVAEWKQYLPGIDYNPPCPPRR